MSLSEAGLRLDTPLHAPVALPTSDVEKPKSEYLLFQAAGGSLSEEAYLTLNRWKSENPPELNFTNRFERNRYNAVGKQFASLAVRAGITITDRQKSLYQSLRYGYHYVGEEEGQPDRIFSLTQRLSDRDVAADVLLMTGSKKDYLKFIRSFNVFDTEKHQTRFFRKEKWPIAPRLTVVWGRG